MTTHTELRARICAVGQSLFERGYVHATAGNISVRLDDGTLLITPTDACLGRLVPDQLAHVSADGEHLGGGRPSKTWVLHQSIYEASRVHLPATACIIHTHSTHLVAASLRQNPKPEATALPELLPPLTPYFVMKVGHVPHVPYHRPGAPEAAQWVAQAIARYGQQGTPLRAVMMARLGPNVWHDTPEAALATLEELEETARLWLMCPESIEPLNAEQLQVLQDQFGVRW